MKKRYLGLDIVRIIAVLMVIGVHSLSKNGYYDISLSKYSGLLVFVLTMFRWLLYTCVPIFIIITGYLKKDKKIDKNHYKSILKIIVEYLIICGIFIIYNKCYLKIDILNVETIINVINFNLMPYAWYLQLYIGLFLIIPFLNVMYNNLPSKKSKRILIVTLVLLCGINSTVNPLFRLIFNINVDLIFSSYLPISYSLSLYFIGAYIKEYQPNLPKIKCIFGIITVLLIQSIITYYYCQGGVFSWSIMSGYGNIFTVIVSTLVFCLVYNIKVDRLHPYISKVISYLSNCSFSVYLISYFVDLHFYQYIKYMYIPWYKMLIMVPLSILLHYIICIVLVSIINIFKYLLKKIVLKICAIIGRKNNNEKN